MRYKVDHDLHIHSRLSLCSNDPEQTPERILKYAADHGLSTVCITDHYWDENIPGAWNWYARQDTAHVKESLPLPKADGISFLFGCECEFTKDMVYTVGADKAELFDFIIIPTTHLHMMGIVSPDITRIDDRAALWMNRFDALLDLPLPFKRVGIAHLTCRLIFSKERERCLAILNAVPAKELERLFTKAAERGVGIEINAADMSYTACEAETVLRPYRIAKSCGCKFYLGSDAHHPKELDAAPEIFERAITALDLSEDDKFII